MRAIVDKDGGVAKLFYKSIFSNDEVPYYKRSAKALQDAVRALKKKKSDLLNNG